MSELFTDKSPPAVGDVSLIVTTAAAGFSTVKSECALIAVKILSAVTSFDVFGLNPSDEDGAELPAASDVNVTVVPSLLVNVSVVPTAILAKSLTVTVACALVPL